eukprot:1408893-Amphidinium_carterae.2
MEEYVKELADDANVSYTTTSSRKEGISTFIYKHVYGRPDGVKLFTVVRQNARSPLSSIASDLRDAPEKYVWSRRWRVNSRMMSLECLHGASSSRMIPSAISWNH